MNEKYEEEVARQFYWKHGKGWDKMTKKEKLKYILDNLNV